MLDPSPAIIRTATWDAVAWTRATTVRLRNDRSLLSESRNILRGLVLNPNARRAIRLGQRRAVRAGAVRGTSPWLEEFCRLTPQFNAMWQSNDVRGAAGEVVKPIRHPALGRFAFEYPFALDGCTGLNLVIAPPCEPSSRRARRLLVDGPAAREHSSGERLRAVSVGRRCLAHAHPVVLRPAHPSAHSLNRARNPHLSVTPLARLKIWCLSNQLNSRTCSAFEPSVMSEHPATLNVCGSSLRCCRTAMCALMRPLSDRLSRIGAAVHRSGLPVRGALSEGRLTAVHSFGRLAWRAAPCRDRSGGVSA